MNDHLNSFDAKLSKSDFYRVFALGCFDVIITLPIAITNVVVSITELGPLFVFYPGWTYNHSDWYPESFPKSMWSTIKWSVLSVHWDEWVNPFYAVVFFVLFGLTAEARTGYRKFFRFLGGRFGIGKGDNTEEWLPDIVFEGGERTNVTVTSNVSCRFVLSTHIMLLNLIICFVVLKQMSKLKTTSNTYPPTRKRRSYCESEIEIHVIICFMIWSPDNCQCLIAAFIL